MRTLLDELAVVRGHSLHALPHEHAESVGVLGRLQTSTGRIFRTAMQAGYHARLCLSRTLFSFNTSLKRISIGHNTIKSCFLFRGHCTSSSGQNRARFSNQRAVLIPQILQNRHNKNSFEIKNKKMAAGYSQAIRNKTRLAKASRFSIRTRMFCACALPCKNDRISRTATSVCGYAG